MTYQRELARTLDQIKIVANKIADMWQLEDYGTPDGHVPTVVKDDDTDITYSEVREMMGYVIDIERLAGSIRYNLRDIQDAIPPSGTE